MECLTNFANDSASIMFTISFSDYSAIIDRAYKDRGGIMGQRGVLRTSTAIRIRKRMIEDIKQSAILPPVVIGAVVQNDFSQFKSFSEGETITWLKNHAEELSLIDGMQRTTAMIEASKMVNLEKYRIRVELWLSKSINSLIYRMLVLNSGQVPWDLRRQLETVLSPVLKEIKQEAPDIEIFGKDESKRRTSPKQYQGNDILELYLVFVSRKEKIDLKEKLSDEFVRLDFLDVTAQNDSVHQFAEVLSLMSRLDTVFSEVNINEDGETHRFYNGIDLFMSQPARVGFVVSAAISMLGRPGNMQNPEELSLKWQQKKKDIINLFDFMEGLSKQEKEEFFALRTLSEKIELQKGSRVGDSQREYFKAAFQTMFEETDKLSSFEVCWNSY